MRWNWFKFVFCFAAWFATTLTLGSLISGWSWNTVILGHLAFVFGTIAVCIEEEKE